MNKLKLNVEDLRVDGFTTSTPDSREGTVVAHFATLRCTGICTEIGSCGQVCP